VTDADLVARAKQGDHASFGELVDRHRLGAYRAAMAALGSHAEAEDAAQDAFVLAWRRLDSFRGDASFRTWLLTIAWHQAINRRRSVARWWKRMVPLDDEGRARLNANTTHAAFGEIGVGVAELTAGFANPGNKVADSAVAGVLPDAVRIDRRTRPGSSAKWNGAPAVDSRETAYATSVQTRTASEGPRFNPAAQGTPEQLASSEELRRDIAKAIRTLSATLKDTLMLVHSGEYTYEEIAALLGAPVGTIKWRVAEGRRLIKKRLKELGHGELG
jgi:RNA polymerase sigma factor (sigma-70 family)